MKKKELIKQINELIHKFTCLEDANKSAAIISCDVFIRATSNAVGITYGKCAEELNNLINKEQNK